MGFVPGEVLEKESMATRSSLNRFHNVQTWLHDNRGMGFVPGEIMKKESMALTSSLNRFHNLQTWPQDKLGWVLSLEKL
jgi:hypothetical protein